MRVHYYLLESGLHKTIKLLPPSPSLQGTVRMPSYQTSLPHSCISFLIILSTSYSLTEVGANGHQRSQQYLVALLIADFKSFVVLSQRRQCLKFFYLWANVKGEEPDTPERWKWTFCHLLSRLCHTLVSSDCWVWAWPCLK